MKNSFQLTEKSNEIVLKILKTGLMVSVVLLFVVFLKDLSNGSLSFVIAIGSLCALLLLTLKGYKVVGILTFEKNEIIADSKGTTIRLPLHLIRRITFNIRGWKRSSYLPSVLQPIGVNRPDGTGNRMEIESNNISYSYDILLQNSLDLTALDFQIKRLADAGLTIEKRKLPTILGDSI
jgi:hypothetical protein